jgi:heme A synthase
LDKTSLIYKISLFGCVFAGILVLLGAYTRLVDAGLGCPDWPGRYAFIGVPDSPEEIQIAEQAYPYAPVEAEKAWPEMIHRYFAGTLGLIIALLTFLAVKARGDDRASATAVSVVGPGCVPGNAGYVDGYHGAVADHCDGSSARWFHLGQQKTLA